MMAIKPSVHFPSYALLYLLLLVDCNITPPRWARENHVLYMLALFYSCATPAAKNMVQKNMLFIKNSLFLENSL